MKILTKCVAKAVTSWMHSLNKSRQFTPGIVKVIHTFARDLKWNPHVNMIVTEDDKGKTIEWRHIRHFAFGILRKRLHKVLLDKIMIVSGDNKNIKALKNKLYKEKNKGFYVHAKTEIKSEKTEAKYVDRYMWRPAIAELRIVDYDGVNVTFKYTRHEDNEEVIETIQAY